MELIKYFIDIFLHLDSYLSLIIVSFGVLTYLILFLVIFCETGLVVTPFLPGDSLLFAAGAFSAKGVLKLYVAGGAAAAAAGAPGLPAPDGAFIETLKVLDVNLLVVLLIIAAFLGDTLNFHIGAYIGPKVFSAESSRLLNKKHLERTHEFYERHGGKTIIIARFVPIIRTFAPFVAGIGKMTYLRFISYNVIGGVVWVAAFIYAGYFFGNIPFVKKNFTMVIMAIIIISVMPAVFEFIRAKRASAKEKSAEEAK